ncbi:hypothetical protein L1987_39076 [Smallanthus sonchifolius]|uniref:Uncharacterized protein n=1 Tax=Smallanthus sonchifolius TaxID=185202 RepID=A0ACB9HMB8_9ASTR|nr:hypothetical protein L1987_39076 [Smallanthus sonchifolius]
MHIQHDIVSSYLSLKNENRKNESHLPIRPNIESCKAGSSSNPMMNSGSVPFGWEHSPGRPKNERNKQIQIMENPPSLPKFFKSRKMFRSECSKSKQKESSGSRNDEDDYDDCDNDEVYMDALGSLSRGVGGLGSDVKSSGFLQADPKMRDFMLGRFLPAARAMASDVPEDTFKKIAIKEKQQQVKKLVNMDSNHDNSQLRYGPSFLQDVSHDKEEEQHDDYDSDYEYHEHGKKSSKFCGLIPRFCSVNLVHGMCVRAKLPISPANRTQASSSSNSSFRETDSEPARSAVYKHRSVSSVMKSGSIEPANLEGSKLYSRLQGPVSLVDLSGSIQSTVSEQSDTSSKKKGISFRELLADKKNTYEITETDSQDSMIEKTLYVDTVHIAESPKESSTPSCTKPQSSSNEPLESDTFADESKHDMKTRKYTDPDAESELFGEDDAKGSQKWKDYDTKLFENPAPPPLPKSPSDSWLCRTLPSVSSKKAPTLWIPKCLSSNTLSNDPKTDENIQLQSPQEQMSPMPES